MAPPRSVKDLLATVDDLEPDAVGELVVTRGGAAVGAVFLEDNRVCWAAARGLGRRLIDLLRDESHLAADELSVEQLFARCRQDGTPLGEALVSTGLVTSEALRAALLTHTVESLCVIARDAERAELRPRMAKSYNARFTFGTGELLVTALRAVHTEVASRADQATSQLRVDGQWCVAFARVDGESRPVPVAAAGIGPEASMTALAELGGWAVDVADLGAGVGGQLMTLIDGHDAGLAVWRCDDLVVVSAAERFGLARMLRRDLQAPTTNHRA